MSTQGRCSVEAMGGFASTVSVGWLTGCRPGPYYLDDEYTTGQEGRYGVPVYIVRRGLWVGRFIVPSGDYVYL